MTERVHTRRRFIAIAGAAAGAPLFGGAARAFAAVRWHGSALGAQVSIDIRHPDRGHAEWLVQAALDEINRLERQFSLYSEDSAIVALNRAGVLVGPDRDLVALLRQATAFADLTDGAFDPTVQPLWRLYARHFADHPGATEGPAAADLAQALAAVGYRGVVVSDDRIMLARRGAAITLNGIAQGYVTDRVTALLRAGGIAHALVDIGEVRAIGDKDGAAWRVGLADAEVAGRTAATIDLVDRAVATTSGSGFRFDREGRFTHLFDPATGLSPALYASVSVIAPTATEADALSTAFSLMSPNRVETVLSRRPDTEARLTLRDGAVVRLGV